MGTNEIRTERFRVKRSYFCPDFFLFLTPSQPPFTDRERGRERGREREIERERKKKERESELRERES